jgi:hypothetical protein
MSVLDLLAQAILPLVFEQAHTSFCHYEQQDIVSAQM